MFRIALYVALWEASWGLGVDDTEKRRSEEILRAVAAAATADYEGIQQMKLQKARTFATLSAARSTAECVEKLQAHLRKEESDLQKESKNAQTDLENELTKNIQYEAEDMKKALHNALQSVYMSVHDRYKQVQGHASAMMQALSDEVNENGDGAGSDLNAENIFKQIIENTAKQLAAEKGSPTKDPENCVWTPDFPTQSARYSYNPTNGVLITGLNTREECAEEVASQYGGSNAASFDSRDNLCHAFAGVKTEDFEASTAYETCIIPEKAPNLTRNHWEDPGNDPRIGGTFSSQDGFEFEQVVLDQMNDMLLAHAQDDVYKTIADTDKEDVQTSLIALNTILAGPDTLVDHSEAKTTVDSEWGHQNGNWTHDLTSHDFGRYGHDTNGNTNNKKWEGRINFEDKQLINVEKAFIEYIKQKSHFHNKTIGHSALDSAKTMVQAKIAALTKSKENIAVYEVELDSLQDDEMRRIADIKEEFESLAADWLQLATYHCCDIVQGNTVECKDATDHLVEPVDKVFPGALKKPDPARDCTRRLL